MVVAIVKSTKCKREMFRFGGQLYGIEKTDGHRLYCRCVRMRMESCPARAVLLEVTIIVFYVLSLSEYLMKAEVANFRSAPQLDHCFARIPIFI